MIYPINFEQKIGFNILRQYVKTRCISPLGENEVDEMAFCSIQEEVISRLNETNEFLNILQSGIDFPLNFVFDITDALNKVRAVGTFLSEKHLFDLKRSLLTISDISQFFHNDEENKYPSLSYLSTNLSVFPALINSIDVVIDKFGNIKDNASPELLNIKKSITNTTSGINSALRRILSKGREEGIIEKDVAPSVRDGRLVIPVSPMYKRKIAGIVHDESATGKTIFIEPAEIVEANNRIRELDDEMKREVIRILTDITSQLRPHIDELLASYLILGKLDFTRAKAISANELGGIMPNVSATPEIEWYHAIHPVLYLALREQHKEVVPLNITLNHDQRILLISGPNAGGKSVCLKTVGITQYMFQCGMLPLVYSNSHMGIFENIFIDIGDEQSIEDDLSTYSSHLKNMKYFINNGDDKTIVLIDEFGGGTEPQIGGAIAQAILSSLNDKKIYGVITTHYQNLKHFAEDTKGIVNGAMLYDRHEMRPLFQLTIGYPGSSFAVEIARKIGLPNDVIANAQEIVGSDYVNMDKYLLDIARDRKYWDNKRQDIRVKEKKLAALVEKYEIEIDNISSERKEIIKNAKVEAKEILSKSNASIERTIFEIKSAQAEKERTKELRKQLDEFKTKILNDDLSDISLKKLKTPHKVNKKESHKPKKEVIEVLKINDYVQIEGSTTIGQIISIEGKKATVAFGAMKTQTLLSKLKKKNRGEVQPKQQQPVLHALNDESRNRQLNFSPDIDVRGMSADESIQAVTYFLDDAIQFSISRVRILHGTGNGILRQRIREYLNTFREVKSYRDENVQFGGAGITVVDLS